MPLPLSVGDIWKIFEWSNSRQAKKKEAVVEWLEAVYKDLEDLTRVWFEICGTLDEAQAQGKTGEAITIIRRGAGASQAVFAGRLNAFYGSVSSVLGQDKQHAAFQRDFINSLGRLLYERMSARTVLDKKLPASTASGGREVPDRLSEMRAAAERLRDQALWLEVSIKNFKAQA